MVVLGLKLLVGVIGVVSLFVNVFFGVVWLVFVGVIGVCCVLLFGWVFGVNILD